MRSKTSYNLQRFAVQRRSLRISKALTLNPRDFLKSVTRLRGKRIANWSAIQRQTVPFVIWFFEASDSFITPNVMKSLPFKKERLTRRKYKMGSRIIKTNWTPLQLIQCDRFETVLSQFGDTNVSTVFIFENATNLWITANLYCCAYEKIQQKQRLNAMLQGLKLERLSPLSTSVWNRPSVHCTLITRWPERS